MPDKDFNRLPPANLAAEQALLGAILANNKAYEAVAEFLQPHHFADPVNGIIYAAAARRANAGQLANAVTLRADFEHSGKLDDVGGPSYLAQLLGAMVSVTNARDYGQVIRDAWLRRELIAACMETINSAYAPPDGMNGRGVMEGLDGLLTRIDDGAGLAHALVSAGEAVEQAVTASANAAKRADGLAGLTTGYRGFNRMLSGFLPGQFYVLGARPAMGKSGIGLGIAARVASLGKRVLFWSGEMSAAQLGTRLAAAHAGLSVLDVFRGRGWEPPADIEDSGHYRDLTREEWDRLIVAQREAQTLPLFFDDRPAITVALLRAKARKMKREKGGLDLIVVDYLGLMRASPEMQRLGLRESFTEISGDLKALDEELEVPLLALSQLNREADKRENKIPVLSDLRESGAIEQDAYCVMFLHRPHYYLVQAGPPVQKEKESAEEFASRLFRYENELKTEEDKAVVMVAKHRSGSTGRVRMLFDGPTTWFRDEGQGRFECAWGDNFMGGV